tara:strand:- start:279 stop:644 length:366 start_codon:yes stop_codon:yes gene_type:complete
MHKPPSLSIKTLKSSLSAYWKQSPQEFQRLPQKSQAIRTSYIAMEDLPKFRHCNSDCGILSDPSSPKSLAQGIKKMLALSDRERDILSQNAFNWVKENFSIATMTSRTLQLYKQILNKAKT